MTKQSIKSILPEPFEMIEIPEGSVLIQDKTVTEIVPLFEIAKYPVTNAQFAKFIEAKGYENREWWTQGGWEAREQGWYYHDGDCKPSGKPWAAPRFWQDDKWNGKAQPVVGVSWYEAVAFCLWLSYETGENIMLPTEQQWQRAAQALPDGSNSRYAYPWGKDWDCKRCNNNVNPCNSNSTTPVTSYEDEGISPCGVADMSGNIWEWCRTGYQTGTQDVNVKDTKVLRGGSWCDNNWLDFLCDVGTHDTPDYSPCDVGFRFVRTL